MQNTQTGFFKVKPLNTSGHKLNEKCSFIWLTNVSERDLILKAALFGSRFYDGCELILAEKDDAEFVDYIDDDMVQVQRDIEKLELLKQRLLDAKESTLKWK